MEPEAADNAVPREIKALLSDERLILRETQRAVTPLGGVAVFIPYLRKIGFVEKVRQHMPIRWRSPNQIDPTSTFTAFLMTVLAGGKRFAHAARLQHDRALHALLGLERFPVDDTIRNLFRRLAWARCIGCSIPWPSGRWSACHGAARATPWTWITPCSSATGTGRSLARAQSPQARTAQSSPLVGRARRSPLPTPRLAPQRQLRVSPWRSGVSPRSPRAVGTAPDDPLGTG